MKFSPALLVSGVLLGVAATAGAAVAAGSTDDTRTGGAAQGAEPPLAAEDFSYPHSAVDEPLKALGFTLKSGDGNVVYGKCEEIPEASRIEITTHVKYDTSFCFRVTGAKGGFITMEIPRVWSIKPGNFRVHGEMTVPAEGSKVTFEAKENEWTGVGKTTDQKKRDHTLLRLEAIK
ncbi:hypothetical protein ABT160_23970 [Streptomyces sp. NPDC001941]|uniref:hypothetical protein n=1 Tax=Streptomyces sp. NPDC001941 TaxID=3154659 RepID=UPI003324E03C